MSNDDTGCLLIIIIFLLFLMMGGNDSEDQHAEQIQILQNQIIKIQSENQYLRMQIANETDNKDSD